MKVHCINLTVNIYAGLLMFRFFILLLISMTVGCSNNSANYETVTELNEIKIGKINYDKKAQLDKAVFFLKQELKRILQSKNSEGRYILNLDITKDVRDTAIQNTTESIRKKHKIIINYNLQLAQTKEVISKGKVWLLDTYSVTKSPYSSYVAQEQASSDLAIILAQKLRLQLINNLRNLDIYS